MIKNRNGIRIINCSFCDNVSQAIHGAEFQAAIADWKDEGWRMFKKDDNPEWQHICPICREANKAQWRRQKEEEGGGFD